MNSVKVNLNKNQKRKLKKAIIDATDFSAKLSPQDLQGDDILFVGKVMEKKINKNLASGKGMVVKSSSNQIKKLAKQMQKDLPTITIIEDKKKKKGGALSVGASLALMGIADELKTRMTPAIDGLTADLNYIINNPSAAKFKNIYANRIPNLNHRYRKLGNQIDFLKMKKTKVAQNRVNRIKLRQSNVASLIEKLIMQLPRLKEIAEQKDNILAEREKNKIEKEIQATEKKLDTLETQLGSGLNVGTGMQVSSGNGLNVGSGMQISANGLNVGSGMNVSSGDGMNVSAVSASGLQVDGPRYHGRGATKKTTKKK